MSGQGAIIEKVIRRSSVNITALAKTLHVERKTIYNWFHSATLPIDTIIKLAKALKYDFSAEFPEYRNFFKHAIIEVSTAELAINPTIKGKYWKARYLDVLEKYNQLLEENQDIISQESCLLEAKQILLKP